MKDLIARLITPASTPGMKRRVQVATVLVVRYVCVEDLLVGFWLYFPLSTCRVIFSAPYDRVVISTGERATHNPPRTKNHGQIFVVPAEVHVYRFTKNEQQKLSNRVSGTSTQALFITQTISREPLGTCAVATGTYPTTRT